MSEGYECLKCRVLNDSVSKDGYCEPCEIKRLEAERDALLSEVERLKESLKPSQEVSRDMQIIANDFARKCEALQAEVERLKFTVNDMNGLIKDCDKERDTLRAEALQYREALGNVTCYCDATAKSGDCGCDERIYLLSLPDPAAKLLERVKMLEEVATAARGLEKYRVKDTMQQQMKIFEALNRLDALEK